MGNVSGSESSDWVRLTGAQFVGWKIIFWCFLEEWRGCGGVGRGGTGDDLLVVGLGVAGGGVDLARFIVGVGKDLRECMNSLLVMGILRPAIRSLPVWSLASAIPSHDRIMLSPLASAILNLIVM